MVVKSRFGGEVPLLTAIGFGEVGLAVFLVILRMYAASKKAGQLRWDFFWVAMAVAWGLVSAGFGVVSVFYGMGNYATNLTFAEIFSALHWFWVSTLLGMGGVVFAKWAIIALLIDIQGPNAKKRRWFLLGLGVLLMVVAIVQIPLTLFQCDPYDYLWDRFIFPASCPRTRIASDFSYFQGAVSAGTDIVLALWPISIVWDLRTSVRVKVGFCMLMALACLPSITSIVRTILLRSLVDPVDPTITYGRWMLWASSELWLVVILGSIPPLRPLFLRWGGKMTTAVSTTMGTTTTKSRGSRAIDSEASGSVAMGSISNEKRGAIKVTISKPILVQPEEEDEWSLVPQRPAPRRQKGGSGIMVKQEFAVDKSQRGTNESKSWLDGFSSRK